MSTPTTLESAALPSRIEFDVVQFGGVRDQFKDGSFSPWRARVGSAGGQQVQVPAPDFRPEHGQLLDVALSAGKRFRVTVTLEEIE